MDEQGFNPDELEKELWSFKSILPGPKTFSQSSSSSSSCSVLEINRGKELLPTVRNPLCKTDEIEDDEIAPGIDERETRMDIDEDEADVGDEVEDEEYEVDDDSDGGDDNDGEYGDGDGDGDDDDDDDGNEYEKYRDELTEEGESDNGDASSDDKDVDADPSKGKPTVSKYSNMHIGVDSLWSGDTLRRRKSKRAGISRQTANSKTFVYLTQEIKDLFEKAQERFVSGNHMDAVDILSSIVQQSPKLPDVYEFLALIHEEMGQFGEALQFYSLASVHAYKTKKSHDIHKKVAELSYFLGYYKKSLSSVKFLLKAQPSPSLHVQKVQLHCKMNAFELAAAQVDRMMLRYPQELLYIAEFADELLSYKQDDLALKYFLKYIFTVIGTTGMKFPCLK